MEYLILVFIFAGVAGSETRDQVHAAHCPTAPGAYYRANPHCDFTQRQIENREAVAALLAGVRQ